MLSINNLVNNFLTFGIFHGGCFEITCENKNYIIFPQKEGQNPLKFGAFLPYWA
jgi:hypothetical protein